MISKRLAEEPQMGSGEKVMVRWWTALFDQPEDLPDGL